MEKRRKDEVRQRGHLVQSVSANSALSICACVLICVHVCVYACLGLCRGLGVKH